MSSYCKRLPATATKAELMAAHRAKMKRKASGSRWPLSTFSQAAQMNRGAQPHANLSKRHPFRGVPAAQLERAKVEGIAK